MLSWNDAQRIHQYNGKNLSEQRKTDSINIMNATFAEDPDYKRVYILDPETGWHYTDAKYSKHVANSILKDDVDYYLQFRPFEHHAVGTYVFVPNDMGSDIGFAIDNPKNPFDDRNFDDIFQNGKLWIIVDRNNSLQFVRYNILKCNWDFKWISNIEENRRIMHVIGMVRAANSYTSGEWRSLYTTQLDTVTSAWIPDTYHVLGKEGLKKFNLDDTRYLAMHDRLMITYNQINPECYSVTKLNGLEPKGIIKVTLKQIEYNEAKDNAELMLCDYYTRNKEIRIDPIEIDKEFPDISKPFNINWGIVDEDNILRIDKSEENHFLHIGQNSYFISNLSIEEDINLVWKIELHSELNSNDKKDPEYYVGLLDLDEIDIRSIRISVEKAKSLIGKQFKLTAQDKYNTYKSELILEVRE